MPSPRNQFLAAAGVILVVLASVEWTSQRRSSDLMDAQNASLEEDGARNDRGRLGVSAQQQPSESEELAARALDLAEDRRTLLPRGSLPVERGGDGVGDPQEDSQGSLAVRTANFRSDRDSADSEGLLLVVYRISTGEPLITMPWDAAQVSAEIPTADIAAHLLLPGAGHGSVAQVPDGRDPCSVTVPAPELCSARMQVTDNLTGDPIGAAVVHMTQTVASASEAPSCDIESVTDANGQILINAICRGSWMVSVRADGYESGSGELAIDADPGSEQDWGSFTLEKLRAVLIRLVGGSPGETFEGFMTELNHSDHEAPVDADGLARLQVGWYYPPIELIVKYPDGRHKISFLHNVEPGSGEETEIRIDGGQLLEVHLRYSDEAAAIIGDSKCWLRVASKGSGSDKFSSGRAVFGEGIYSFPDVFAAEAEVSFATAFGDWPDEWASTSFKFEPGRKASVELLIDRAPRRVQLVETERAPVADFSYQLVREGDRTAFTMGNLSDADGMTTMMHGAHAGFLFSGSKMDGSLYALDAPFSFDPDSGDPVVAQIGPSSEFFLDVVVAGAPPSGVAFNFHGGGNGSFFWSQATGDLGRTGAARFTNASQIRVFLDSPDHWWDLPHLDLQPGRNPVALKSIGTISAGTRDAFSQVTALDYGIAVEEWVQSGKVNIQQDESNRWTCRLPVGSYSVTSGSADPITLQLTKGGQLGL